MLVLCTAVMVNVGVCVPIVAVSPSEALDGLMGCHPFVSTVLSKEPILPRQSHTARPVL